MLDTKYLGLFFALLAQIKCSAADWNQEIGHASFLDASLVYLHSRDLELMLLSDKLLKSNSTSITNQTFFESFKKFLISFEMDGDEIYTKNMENLLTMAVEYKGNIGEKRLNKNVLEIWVAIIPNKNVSRVLNKVLDMLTKITLKHGQIVSTLLLNYRSFQLRKDSVHAIRADLKVTRKLLEGRPYIVSQHGIVLELNNCIGKWADLIYELELTTKEKLVYMSQLTSDSETIRNPYLMVECFEREKKLGTRPLAQITMEIEVNLTSGVFYLPHKESILDFYQFLAKGQTQPVFIIKTNLLDKKQMGKNKTAPEQLDAAWLKRDTNFDKKFFGVSLISPPKLSWLSLMIPTTLAVFRKIIVESTSNVGETVQFVQSITRYKVNILRQDKSGIFDDGIPVQMMVVANTFPENEKTAVAVSNAWTVSQIGNAEYPGIVDTILVSVPSCNQGHKLCPGAATRTYFERRENASQIDERKRQVFMGIQYYAEYKRKVVAKNMYLPKVGIIWDMRYFEEMAMFMKLARERLEGKDNITKSKFHVDILILEVLVEKSDIIENGAEQKGVSITQEYLNCEFTWTKLFQNEKRTFPIYIKIAGCKGSESTLQETAELAKFWELMSSWAVKENRTVFMDTAFELEPRLLSNETLSNLARRVQNVTAETKVVHRCGWWKVMRNKSVIKEDKMILVEDLKSIAVRLYDEVYTQPKKPFRNLDKQSTSGKLIIIVLASTIIVTVLIVLVSSFLIVRYRSKYILSRQEMNSFIRGSQKPASDNDFQIVGSGKAESQPYNKIKYELSRHFFKINKTRNLGSGEFGTVYFGIINRNDVQKNVAVKMVKSRRNDNSHGHYLAVKGLISEIKILSYVGEHPNVVKLEGAYTAKLRNGSAFIFLEFCEQGSLDKYLRNYKPFPVNTEVKTSNEEDLKLETKNQPLPEIMCNNLHKWSVEIACGMDFLASKKIVHADLATRNILLNHEKIAKISDFGLSRRLYDYTEYLKTESEPLPWRYMAPESLRRMIFNEKSDVWAFGVTLWEMYTLGDEPYPGLSWDLNFPTFLERGLRLQEPRYNTRDTFSVMKLCWKAAADERPTFSQLESILRKRSELKDDKSSN